MTSNKLKCIIFSILALYFIVFTYFSFLSPVGYWQNTFLGREFVEENDPGGPYLFSSVELMNHEKTLLVTHPGLSLQYFLYGITKSCFHLLKADDSISFQAYVARNLRTVFFWSKVGMSLLHLTSFALLFYFSSMLFKREIATLSTLLYMTSFLPLFYFSKISPEPFIIIFFLAILIIMHKIHSRRISLTSFSGAAAAFILAFLSVAGMFTKMNLLAAAPLIVFVFILYVSRREIKHAGLSFFSILHAPLIFLFSAVALFFLFSIKIDWSRFFVFWRGVLEGNYYATISSPQSFHLFNFISDNLSGMMFNFLGHIKVFLTKNLIYHFRTNNPISAYPITEWRLLIVAGFGVYYFIKNKHNELSFILWPSLFLLFNLLAYIVKPIFNYAILFHVIFSIFAAYGLIELIDRFLVKEKINKTFAAGIAIVLIHYLALYAIVNSRFDDTKLYRSRCEPYYEAIEQLPLNRKLGIVLDKTNNRWPLNISWNFVDKYSKIMQEVEATYTRLEKNTVLSMSSKSEALDFFRENRIDLIIEADAEGQPAGDYMTIAQWADKNYSQ